jgi:hypothetical protein
MEDMVISKYPNLIEVSRVELLAGFTVRVTFTDSSQRVIDLEPYLFGPVFESIHNDLSMFRRVFVDHGALTWSNGADIDTDTLYYEGPPPWAQKHRTVRKDSKATTVKHRISQQSAIRRKSKPRTYAAKSPKPKTLRT